MALSSLTLISGFSMNSSDRYAYTVTEGDKTFACCRNGEKTSDKEDGKRLRFQSLTFIDGETLKTIRQTSSNIIFFSVQAAKCVKCIIT